MARHCAHRPTHRVAVSRHTDGADGVSATVTDVTTGAYRKLAARDVIAADGSASAVRRALRVTMDGPVLQHLISVHFSADLERFRDRRRGPVIWTHTAKGLGAVIAHRPPQDLVFQIPNFPPFESLEDFPAAVCRRHILDAVGADVDIEIKSIQSGTMHAQVADRFRVGRTSWPATPRIGSRLMADSDSTQESPMSTTWPGNWPGSFSRRPEALRTRMSRSAFRSASLRPPIQWRISRDCSKSLPHWVYRGKRYVCCLEPSPPSRNGYRGAQYVHSSSWAHHARVSTPSPGQLTESSREPHPCRAPAGHRRTGPALPQLGGATLGALPVRRRDSRRAAFTKQ